MRGGRRRYGRRSVQMWTADGADVDGGRCRYGRRTAQIWTADGADMDGGRCRYPLLKV